MGRCVKCGGKLHHIHRTFLERFAYMAVYECPKCESEILVPRQYRHHFGHHCRCPRCGTYKVVRLPRRDRIDPLETGFLNLLERLAGGKLYHCCFCRVQFYDRRLLAAEGAAKSPTESEVATPPNTASSGV